MKDFLPSAQAQADPVPGTTAPRATVRVAVVQAAPVILDREATTRKVCRLIEEAGARGARLILLPEAMIPAYPRGMTFGTVVGHRSDEGRRAYARYWDQCVDVPGPVTEAIGAAARAAGAYVAVGVGERGTDASRAARHRFRGARGATRNSLGPRGPGHGADEPPRRQLGGRTP